MLTHLYKIPMNVWTATDEGKDPEEHPEKKEGTRGETATWIGSRKEITKWFCR